jgi:hypothetical protein
MTDIPILFSPPMVQALLAGRKTQTRRLLNPQPIEPVTPPLISFNHGRAEYSLGPKDRKANGDLLFRRLPIFGDRLWVRETWHAESWYDRHPAKERPRVISEFRQPKVWYPAGYMMETPSRWRLTMMSALDLDAQWSKGVQRPGIHMPRWASRLTLIVQDVRFQRLQDLTEADAEAEGIVRFTDIDHLAVGSCTPSCEHHNYVDGYRCLWNRINEDAGKRFVDNPWIYAVTFKVDQRNIDSS